MLHRALFLVVFLISLAHIFVGSSFLVVLFLACTCLLGCFSVILNGSSFGGAIFFLWTVYYGWGALLVKLIVAQPLQDNLVDPIYSSFIVFFCSLIIFFLTCASSVFEKKSKIIFDLNRSIVLLEDGPIIPLFLVFGTITQFLHVYFTSLSQVSDSSSDGFGGFSVFHPFYYISLAAIIKISSRNKGSWAVKWIVFALIFSLIMGVVGNAKKILIETVFMCLLCSFFFNVKINYKKIAPLAVVISIAMLYITPAIHIIRNDSKSMSASERLYETFSVIYDNDFSIFKLYDAQDKVASAFEISFQPDYAYFYPNTINADRYSLVSAVDQVARVDSFVFNGSFYEALSKGFLSSLPFYKKDPYTNGDMIAWSYGIRSQSSIARPVLGQVVHGYAISGFIGSIFACFIVGIFIALCNFIFGKFEDGAISIAAFVYYLPFPEQTIDTSIIFMIRNMFFFMMICGVFYAAIALNKNLSN